MAEPQTRQQQPSHPDDWVTPKDDWVTPGGASSQASPSASPSATSANPPQEPGLGHPFATMPDPFAAMAHGAISVPVEAGRLVNQYGAKPLGWDLSRLVPPSMQRGYEKLTERANQGGGTVIGEAIGSALPFAGAPAAARALPLAGRVLMRSVLPALLQPTTGPVDPTTKALQTVLGTGLGESLHGLSWLARTPLGKWAAQQAKGIADKAWEETAAVRDQLQRVITGRGSQLSETAARTAARDAEVAGRERTFQAAQTEYQRQAREAAEVEARNRARQQVVDRLNQRNELDFAGQRAQAATAATRQADVPRQATQGLLNDALGLIGERPREFNLTRETAPQVRERVGQELERLYGQMSFDPNQGGWLASAARIQRDIANRLRQDPRAQALWAEVFQDKAFMPGLRSEAGAGAPVQGVAPGTVRSPTGQSFAQRSLPTGEIQGPLGTRSGPISGDQLGRMMSVLTKAQQRFGLEAQSGGGGIYRDMAEGLARMRQSVEAQLDARFPQLAEQRRLANQAYFLTSRVMDAVDPHGMATPEQLLKAFKSAEGDTRFGTDQRYADIKDRLERQHRDFTNDPDKPTRSPEIKGYNEPVPKVGKEPAQPAPVPPIKPVPLTVPKSTRVPAPVAGTDERLPPGAAHLASEAAGHLGRAAGIPGVGRLTRAALSAGKPAARAVLRPVRDWTRVAATPVAIGTSRGVAGLAAQQQRRKDERQRRRQQQQRNN